MKILYVITKSNYGGAQKYVFELANNAKNKGFNVSFACGGTGQKDAKLGRLAEKLVENDISVLPIKNFMRDMSPLRDCLALLEIYKILKKERPDVLHVTSSKAGGVGALAGRLAGIEKIIFTSHGLTMDETWRPKWQRLLITIGTWFTLKLSHQSIMINTETFLRARALPTLHDSISLIKNGVSEISFIEKGEARAELVPHLPGKTTWLGGIGELHANKNWATAIHTLASLPKEVHLVVIGEGEERQQLQLLADNLGLSNRVHLVGYIENASRYLKAFDIFILPSKKEGLPYVLLEAGLAGLPVIASDIPGNHDIIETGMTGLLVEPNPKLLTTSVQFLLRDEGLRRRLGHELELYVHKNFSIERMCSETFALYESSKSPA